MKKLQRKLKSLPKNPGVYLFKDSQGEVLYIGKAKNLKNRVTSYFRKSTGVMPKTEIMISQIRDLDYIVVSSETESLILENTLIKRHLPPYNVLLRDDKNYQFIKIDYAEEIPQVFTVRKIEGKGKYFGPYTSGLSVKRTMKLLKSIFHLCQNKKRRKKPCFAYHLKRCPGVCIKKISLSEYKKTVRQIEGFLKNEQKQVLGDLRAEMADASTKKQFEKAATLRDKVRALTNIWERQKMISPKNENADFVGLYSTSKKAFINLFMVRGGKLIHRQEFELAHIKASDDEIIKRFITQYYIDSSNIPIEIYLPLKLTKIPQLEKGLRGIKGVAVKIHHPLRGKKKQLVELAEKNAKLMYKKSLAVFEEDKRIKTALERLKKVLRLKKLPSRIEGFDISNIQGTNPVGSMVVFINGFPDKKDYRKFKIKTKTTPDDVAMMTEMLTRRLKRIGEKNKDSWPRPDLIIIDGGKGQLNAAYKIFKDFKQKIPIIGLAKRLEEIFVPGKKNPLILRRDSEALKLLQRVRDEAHRFAITFHKKRRGRSQIKSRLDDIPGVGPATKKNLVKKFGTISAIRKASLEKLAEEVGINKARKIKEQL